MPMTSELSHFKVCLAHSPLNFFTCHHLGSFQATSPSASIAVKKDQVLPTPSPTFDKAKMSDPQKRPAGVRTYEGADNWEDYRTEFARFAKVVPRKGNFSLWGVISGTEPKPQPVAPGPRNANQVEAREQEIRDWEDQDALGLHWISCTVHEKKRHVIRNAASSNDAWTTLQAGSDAQSGSTVINNFFKLYKMRQEDFNSMQDYISSIQNQARLLENHQIELHPLVIVSLMIHNLSDQYALTKALLQDKEREVLTFDFVRSKLLEAEKQMQEQGIVMAF